MLIVTEGARQRLAQMLEEIQATEELAVRLVLVGDEMIATEPGIPRRGDVAFEYDGRVVLVLDEKAQAVLADQVLCLDGIEQELDLAPQRLSSVPREPGGISPCASCADQQCEDGHGAAPEPSGMSFVRVRIEEDCDAIYH